ncbi:F0F1-type ATP synthase membrane subunit b/b' [Sphingopyxis sp. JAI128]|nr:F0F1-type ATP synthase membrane subunit b/b' [Sphingopyxis sp. JAI128]
MIGWGWMLAATLILLIVMNFAFVGPIKGYRASA